MIQLDFRRKVRLLVFSYESYCDSNSDFNQKPPTACDTDSATLVAATERSFSLKLIISYLRSVMSHVRVSNLSFLSTERDLAEKIDFNNVISEFARITARKATI